MCLSWTEDISVGAISESSNIQEIRTFLDSMYDDLVAGVYGSGADLYEDLLGSSVYFNCSWDAFADQTLVDTGNSTMTYDSTKDLYDFTIGEVLQSEDLYDATLGVTITECMVSIYYTDDGVPTIEATADGVNWETVINNVIHEFTDTGTTLKIRFTGGGTGQVLSWGVLYNPDTGSVVGATRRKYIVFYYEGVCQDEDIIVDGFYFGNKVGIDSITLHARVAPTGDDITVDLLDGGAEQSKVATLTAASTYEKTDITTEYFEDTDRFGLIIKQIGSTEPGQGLLIIIHYYDVIS